MTEFSTVLQRAGRSLTAERELPTQTDAALWNWMISGAATSFIDHPLFHEKDAARLIFTEDEPLESKKSTKARRLLSRAGEQAIFKQYNFCRFQLSRMTPIDSAQITAAVRRELIAWGRAALSRRDRIVECNLGLVPSMMRTVRSHWSDYDELLSAGHLAILHAVDKFDVNRGFRFSTYVCQAIQRAMAQTVAQRVRQRQRLSVLAQQTRDEAVEEEHGARACALPEEVGQLHDMLRSNRARLTEMEQRVIQSRFPLPSMPMATSMVNALSREEIGRLNGVTKERVRQIERKALTKLRRAMETSFPTEALSVSVADI